MGEISLAKRCPVNTSKLLAAMQKMIGMSVMCEQMAALAICAYVQRYQVMEYIIVTEISRLLE